MTQASHKNHFLRRHIGPSENEIQDMLKMCEVSFLEELIEDIIPKSILDTNSLKLKAGESEHSLLKELQTIADQNQIFQSYIGMGYSGTITPTVILRNISGLAQSPLSSENMDINASRDPFNKASWWN